MQKITKLLSTNRLIACVVTMLCIIAVALAFTTISSGNEEIKAEAASTVISSQSDFNNAFKTGTETVTGSYELSQNITISSRGLSEATFNGSFNGNGYTITITGTHHKDFGTLTSVSHKYVGFFAGVLGNRASISNVTIIVDGDIRAFSTNNVATSGDYNDGANYSTTLYLGTLAGRAQSGANITNVNITFSSGGDLHGIGIDGNSNAQTHASGQGSVVGGVVGVTEGAYFTNLTFNNNGSIWAKAENKNAGRYSYMTGGFWGMNEDEVIRAIALTDSKRADRASAGGIFGESSASTTTINNLVYSGSGYVGARTQGDGVGGSNYKDSKDSAAYRHNINHAGGVVGYAKGGKIAINGMLYRYSGKIYVAHTDKSGKYFSGVILGKGSNASDVTINDLWRNPTEGTSSGFGYYTYESTSSGPSASGCSSNVIATKVLSSAGTLSSVATNDASNMVQFNTQNETRIKALYKGNDVTTTSTLITNIKNGYLEFSVGISNTNYYIGSVHYRLADYPEPIYIKYYNEELTRNKTFGTEEFMIPINCLELCVYITTVDTPALYVNCDGDKQYDRRGIEFTGLATSNSPGLLSNLYWSAEHDSNPDYNVDGALGAGTFSTNQNVGTYTISLYRKLSDGSSVKALAGDSLGPDELNTPTVIYKFDGSSYSYTIHRAEIELKAVPGASYTKQYDGTSNVHSRELILNKHFTFYRVDTNTQLDETPEVSFGSGKFFKGSEETYSVGTGLRVVIEDFEVTGNYVLSDSSIKDLEMTGEITKAQITINWGSTELVYDGSLLHPVPRENDGVAGLIGTDTVELDISVYTDENLDYGVTSKTEVGTYYAKAELASASANYDFRGGFTYVQFTVVPKELRLTWQSFNEDYNYSERAVSCVITDKDTEVAEGDVVGVTITYSLNGVDNVKLLNAGSYTAKASISNKNYYLNENDVNFGDDEGESIIIRPIKIKIVYYTASNDDIQPLVYMASSYIGHVNGLHARIHDDYTTYGIVNNHIKLNYGDATVTDVGEYNVTASLGNSANDSENNNIILTNYEVHEDSASTSITIVPRELTLEFSTRRQFEYDIKLTEESSWTIAVTGMVGLQGQDSVNILSTVYNSNNESVSALSVGNYTVKYAIDDNDNYVLSESSKEQTFSIYAYDLSRDDRGELKAITQSYEYTTKAIEPSVPQNFVTLKTGGTLVEDEHYTISYENNVNAGNGAIVRVTGKNNFSGSITTNFTITKKTLDVTFSNTNSNSYEYNGNTVNITYSIIDLDGNDLLSASKLVYNETPKFVGDYVATVSFVTEQPNYQLSSNERDRQFAFSIQPKAIALRFTDTSEKVYNGKAQYVSFEYATANAICSGDTVTLVDRYYSKSQLEYVQPIKVGAYRVTVELTGAQANNYVLSNYEVPDYQIVKRQIKLVYQNTVNGLYTKTYGAKDLSLVFGTDFIIDPTTPAVQNEDTRVYLSYKPSTEGANISQGSLINVGEYTIMAYTSNDNYEVIESSGIASIEIVPYELELYYDASVTQYYYRGSYSPIQIPNVEFSSVKKPFTSDEGKFNIIRTFYNVEDENTEVPFLNAGTYGMKFKLEAVDKNSNVSNNYVINQNNISELEAIRLTIKPRQINVIFTHTGNATYNGIETEIGVVMGDNQGQISGDANSGLVRLNSAAYENIIDMINVTTVDANGNNITKFKDVGSYTSTFELDSSVINYVIGSSVSRTNNYTITPKELFFYTDNFSKTYGDADKAFTQMVDGLNGERIEVSYGRKEGENAGTYTFNEDSITYDNANYDISFATPEGELTHGVFTINKRHVTFAPDANPETNEIDRFTFDYLDPINDADLTMEISITPAMPLFPNKKITIQLFKGESGIVNTGVYNLSSAFEWDDETNFELEMKADSYEDMIEIIGRSVLIDMPDLYMTYEKDEIPEYFDYLKVIGIENCDASIRDPYNAYVLENGSDEGFDWSNFIRIEREEVPPTLKSDNGKLPYKKNGYALTIYFLKNGEIDKNYRAVRILKDEAGNQIGTTDEIARLFVEKFDLNTVYGPLFNDTKPKISLTKPYDGKNIAFVELQNIKEIHSRQSLSISATFDNVNAGSGKAITISYAFTIVGFDENYILPEDYVYSIEGEITPLNVNVKINEQDMTLTYGETPQITLSYSGFIGNDNINSTGIEVKGVYNDGAPLSLIRNASQNDYVIVLQVVRCDTPNYVLNFGDKQLKVKINPKNVALVAGKPYEKPVDGTKDAFITPDNYVIEGLLEQDLNLVHIESSDITAMLNSSEPGETTALIRVNKLSGAQKDNYNLSNYELIIPAVIKKLADVTMGNVVVDFDNTQKTVVPVLENVLEGVKYYVEYTGINVQYATTRIAPKNAGTYSVACYVHNADNTYSRELARAELVINKVKPSLFFTGNFSQVYGSFTAIEAAVKSSGLEQKIDVDYSFVGEDGQFPAFPPAGRHTVKASYEESDNYLAVSGEQSLVIAQKTISITFDNYKNLVYNGYDRSNDILITFNGLVKGDTCTPIKLFNANEVKNAGTYRLIVSPSNPSYVISGSNSVEFTIQKKMLQVTVGNDTVTTAGVAPEFTMKYTGFVENEDERDLATPPSVKLSSGKVGVNLVEYKEGFDENYSFTYIDCVYTIVYESENEDKPNLTPYIAAGASVGSIGLIFLIGYMVKIHNYRSMTKYVAKRTIKKAMFKSKNIK